MWVAAVLISCSVAFTWTLLQHMDDATAPANGTVIREGIPILGLVLLSQIGLILAPLAQHRRWRYRAMVAVLMN